MRALAGVAALILAVGGVGVAVTFLANLASFLFLVGAIAALAVVVVALLGDKRIRAMTRLAEEKSARDVDELEFEKSIRHPAWDVAIAARRAQRQQLADRFVVLGQRVRRCRPHERRAVARELAAVESLVFLTFGRRVSAVQPGIRELLDPEPPRAEVIHLDREFMRIGDCRYGHWDEHLIDESGGGRVLRRCAYCEPNTCWTERV